MFLKEQTPAFLLDQREVTPARGRNILYIWILMLDVSCVFVLVIAKYHLMEMKKLWFSSDYFFIFSNLKT